jgi:PEP-CTERM/exosortase A-associated glycosyltransferase
MTCTDLQAPVVGRLAAPRRVLHVLDHSQPHRSGYALRSKSILEFQRALGFEPVVLTSPKHGPAAAPCEEIGAIVHHRTDPARAGLAGWMGTIPFVREQQQMRAMRHRIEAVVREEGIELIHAHSPSLNGIPASAAARQLGLPMVYEVRAFWEDAAVDHGTFSEGSLRYRLSRALETRLLRRAHGITVICEGIRAELIARGIPADRITIIPNGVDLERFAPRAPNAAVIERYGLRDSVVIGFLGSFYHYEGLPILLNAFAQLRDTVPHVRLLLAGGGEVEQELRAQADRLGLGSAAIFTGSVAPEQVLDLYSAVDILVYPRLSMRITDWVTPLKPLEAMALGKVVVASDVGGLKELIIDKQTGLLFRAGDCDRLAAILRGLVADRALWPVLGAAARQHVLAARPWPGIVAGYRGVYERAVARAFERRRPR